MSKKSSLIEWSDRVLFAPWRYMDIDGNNTDQGTFANFIHKPELKVAILSTAALTSLNFSALQTAQFLLMGTIATAAYTLGEASIKKSLPAMHVDAYPQKPRALKKDMRTLIEALQSETPKKLLANAFTAAMGAGAGKLATGDNLLTLKCGLFIAAFLGTKTLADHYRLTRIFKEEWNLMVGNRPREPQAARRLNPSTTLALL